MEWNLIIALAMFGCVSLAMKDVNDDDFECKPCMCNGSRTSLDIYCNKISGPEIDNRSAVTKLVGTEIQYESSRLNKSDLSFPSLNYLQLTNSGIKIVSVDAFQLVNSMKHLDLSDNDITYLNCNIFTSNTALHTLILAGNNITLPMQEPFLAIQSLRHLDLSRCHLTYIPTSSFEKMDNLVTLNLSHNLINVIYGNEFSKLRHLSVLYLDYIGIKLLNATTFQHNHELKKLSLIGNIFLSFDANGFDFLRTSSLQILLLDECRLFSLPSYSFTSLQNLKTLSVNTNCLTFIDFSAIEQLPSLQQLSVLSNELVCGCIGENQEVCCSGNRLEILATCKETTWDVARNITCRDTSDVWATFRLSGISIAVGCATMLLISLILLIGPRMYYKRNEDNNEFEITHMGKYLSIHEM